MNRAARRQLESDNRQWPPMLLKVPPSEWPPCQFGRPQQVYRSRDFLVLEYPEREGRIRLSICRTTLSGAGWADGIAWDDLQRLKSEAGYGDRLAVEIYPADHDVVNVANMRHLWLLPEPLSFAWRAA